ncbi:MAG TPA: glycosyltransferase family 39 protein [Candidatus Saccharimonadia bacterium]|nr:glycosyltransferase family 39 protein [Candidatus Saccharimonadia bacterium]
MWGMSASGSCSWRCLAAWVVCFLYAGALLSIGITKDWRLRHEDNGAVYSTFALAHLRLGLAETRAHDFFYNPHTDEKTAYGHHPPGLGLVLAAVFKMVGSEAPWVARTVPILFHLGSLALLGRLLSLFLDRWSALLGGFLMATLPESAYFGRMVGYEPLGLFCVMLQLYTYSSYRLRGRRASLVLLAAGVILGGLVDWPPLYFSLGLCVIEFVGWLRGSRTGCAWLVLAAAGTIIVFFDLIHMAYACGSLERLAAAVFNNPHVVGQTAVRPMKFVLTQAEVQRRFFTHAGLTCSMLTLLSLLGPALRVIPAEPRLLRELLGVCFGAGFAYLVSIAGYAMSHQYSQFYLLPTAIISMVLAWNALCSLRQRRPNYLLTFLAALFVIDVAATSAVTLYYRHTHPEAYALRTTAHMRMHSLLPPYPSEKEH